MDISHWITHRADWSPDKIAVRFEGQEIAYAAMEARIAQLAGALRGLGVGQGDRVAHLGLNSPLLLEMLFACARLGAIFVPLNWRLTVAEHAFQIGDCTPSVLFAEPDWYGHGDQLRQQFPGLRTVAYGKPPDGDGWLDHASLVGSAPEAERDAGIDL